MTDCFSKPLEDIKPMNLEQDKYKRNQTCVSL